MPFIVVIGPLPLLLHQSCLRASLLLPLNSIMGIQEVIDALQRVLPHSQFALKGSAKYDTLNSETYQSGLNIDLLPACIFQPKSAGGRSVNLRSNCQVVHPRWRCGIRYRGWRSLACVRLLQHPRGHHPKSRTSDGNRSQRRLCIRWSW